MWDHCSESKNVSLNQQKDHVAVCHGDAVENPPKKKKQNAKISVEQARKIKLEMVSLPEKLPCAEARASKTRRMHGTHNVTTLHCGNAMSCVTSRAESRRITR